MTRRHLHVGVLPGWGVIRRIFSFLLTEDGDRLLLEDGSKIKLED